MPSLGVVRGAGGALRLLEPALDANYERVKENTYPFPAADGARGQE